MCDYYCVPPPCTFCKNTEFIQDGCYRTCVNCATVAECILLVDEAEWRTFAEELDPNKDRSRVGEPNGHIETVIGGGGKLSILNRRIAPSSATPAKHAQDNMMETLQHRLNLPDSIVDIANEILKEYATVTKCCYKGDSRRLYFVAAALMYASNSIPNGTRSRKEVCEAAEITNTRAFHKVSSSLSDALSGTQVEKSLMRSGAKFNDHLNRMIDFLPTEDRRKVR